MTHFLHDPGAGVEGLVDAVPKAHEAEGVLLVLGARQGLGDVVPAANLLQHAQHCLHPHAQSLKPGRTSRLAKLASAKPLVRGKPSQAQLQEELLHMYLGGAEAMLQPLLTALLRMSNQSVCAADLVGAPMCWAP